MHYLDDQELRALLEVTYRDNRLLHMAVLLTAYHGLRINELLQLKADDVQGRYLRVKALKKGTERLEPIRCNSNPLLDESLVAVHANSVRVCNQFRLFPWYEMKLSRMFKKACTLAGIPPQKAHWHSLRHSTAMMAFRGTVSLGSVKEVLRHKSSSAALVYLSETNLDKGYDAVTDGLNGLFS